MGKVDHADDAVNHRIADCHEPIDGSESQPVYELLDKIFHIFSPADAILGGRIFRLNVPDRIFNFFDSYRFRSKCEVQKKEADIISVAFAARDANPLGIVEKTARFPHEWQKL
jgi:hypothetical protein